MSVSEYRSLALHRFRSVVERQAGYFVMFYSHYSILEVFSSEVLFEVLSHLEWYDLLVVAQTCTTFRDLVQSGALWQRMKMLDFCRFIVRGISASRVLYIVEKCPNAEQLILGPVDCSDLASILSESAKQTDDDVAKYITNYVNHDDDYVEDDDDDDVGQMEDENSDNEDNGETGTPSSGENLNTYDRLILEILRKCPRLCNINVTSRELTSKGVCTIAAKCIRLRSLWIADSLYVHSDAITDIVSTHSRISQLSVQNCQQVVLLNLKHRDPNILLGLQSVRLVGVCLNPECVETLARNCPMLECLDLSESSLSQLTPANVHGSNFPRLKQLLLKSCLELILVEIQHATELMCVDVSECLRLRSLSLECVSLQTITTTSCQSLQLIKLNSGSLECLSINKLPTLSSLSVQSPVLKKLDVSYDIRLTVNSLEAMQNLHQIEVLNIMGCKQLPPNVVNENLLPKMPALKELKHGGDSWSEATLKSSNLIRLEFKDASNLCSIALQMPKLTSLHLASCRDFMEMEMLDGMLLGKWVKRFKGLMTKSMLNNADENNDSKDGLPNLRHLVFENIQNLQGDIFSARGKKFEFLTTLAILSCKFLRHLEMDDWPCLETIQIISCSKLTQLKIINCSQITSVTVQWCGMVESLKLLCENLQKLNVTGTSFGAFTVHSSELIQLEVTGICMMPHNSADIRCPKLESICLHKCDSLTDNILQTILTSCTAVTSLQLTGCHKLSQLTTCPNLSSLRLTGLRRLTELFIHPDSCLKEFACNNLTKITPDKRQVILSQNRDTLDTLEVRSLPNERELVLDLPLLRHLTLDQGIHLTSLAIICPNLLYLRIQGCPNLLHLQLHVLQLPLLQVDHSSPLIALKTLHLSCHNVKFLARVLGFYTPNLEHLTLIGDNTSVNRILSVGNALPKLWLITLNDCTPQEDLIPYFPTSFVLTKEQLQRYNDLTLTVMFEESS